MNVVKIIIVTGAWAAANPTAMNCAEPAKTKADIETEIKSIRDARASI